MAAIYMTAISSAQDTVTSYESNLTEKLLNRQIDVISMANLYNTGGFAVAEAVKFKAPRSGWNLTNVTIIGTDGFNGTAQSVPPQGLIALEIRDRDLNLLYRFTDSQIPYTNFILNVSGLYPITFEIPAVPVSDEFYVCFYDRGVVFTAFELVNETKESYTFNRFAREMSPAELPISENETVPINWIMRVNGV